MADRASGQKGISGFTLLEALVAIIMLAAIMAALTLALSTALRAQQTAQTQQERMGTVRAVFALIARDVQAALASNNNPACVFMATPPGAGNTNASSLLTLTTLTHRIDSHDPNVNGETSGLSAVPPQNANSDSPQADFALVRYVFAPNGGTLTRTVSAVPNLQTLTQSTPSPKDTVAQNLQDVHLRFWDPNQQMWREDWDFEQQNQQSAQGQNGQTGVSSNSLANNSTTGNANSGSGDTSLPSAVEITVTLGSKEGALASYSTTIPVLTPQVPTDPNAAGSAGGTGGSAGTGAGAAGGGGP